MANLRAGLVGLGVMGRHHARILGSLEGVDFVGVAETNEQLRAALPDVQGFESAAALLREGLDYCVVAAPTALHQQIGMELASAGVHTLIEKPLAANPDEASRLLEAFTTAGVIGAVGHIERFNPALQEARNRIDAGQLGRVHQLATRRQGPFPARISDVGVIKDLATHDIDLTAWLVGSPFVRVSAETSCQSGRAHEDFVAAVGQLYNGVITNHLVNWLSPLKERTTVVTGERGSFVVDTLTADITFYSNGAIDVTRDEVANFRGVREGDVIRYAIPKPEPLRTEHEAFRDAVLGKSSHVVTMAEGLATVRVAQAMIDSAQQGRPVTLGRGKQQ